MHVCFTESYSEFSFAGQFLFAKQENPVIEVKMEREYYHQDLRNDRF